MGLPLFITPVEPEVASKSAEKLAAGPRSAIRRRSTIRPQRSSGEVRRRRMLGLVERTGPEEYQIWESQNRSTISDAELTSVASLQARAQRMFEEEQSRTREPFSFERQTPPINEPDGPMMPPVPESRDYASIEIRQREIQRLRQARQDLRRMARRHPAPTPPYTDNDPISVTRPGTDSPRPSSLTPALSPLRQPSGDSSPRRPLEESEFTFTSRDSLHSADQRPRLSLSERVQAINRASNEMGRSRRIMRQARLDGLGDRDRSLSPGEGAAWDTLLTSITPDPQPPSTGSSFASTSAAAAASSSSNSGPLSASTSMISSGGTQDPTLRDCDISDSGSNSDEEEEEDIYELQDFNNNNNRSRGERFWRTYASVVTAGPNRASRHNVADTEHLDGMHRIISRLAERDEIPDSWWASAGLSRNLRREPAI